MADEKEEKKPEKKPDAPKKEKAVKRKKEDVKKAGFAANIEEGLQVQPARLKLRYRKEVVPQLMKTLNLKNPMEVPRINKVVVNMGLGEALANNKILESAVDQLGAITGQKPVVTRSRKAIANFKLREGQAIGAMVTLRGDRMFEFLDRLINVALPRVRDFKGVSPKAFDGRGNYTLGLREQIIFPEINYDQIEKVKGLNVSIVTSAGNDERALALLKAIGVPFRA
ncbi:MAG: 50S ribosomal protein L5 [Archangium sp.]|nr:50S ribosomal protein L5 [Archangium sp.]